MCRNVEVEHYACSAKRAPKKIVDTENAGREARDASDAD
jgi:hypothetical protein